jgi:hypothetical protein
MKALKSHIFALVIGFILGIITTLIWQQNFEIIPRYSIEKSPKK